MSERQAQDIPLHFKIIHTQTEKRVTWDALLSQHL